MNRYFLFGILGLFFIPMLSIASYYTLPIDDISDPDVSIYSWFDHDPDQGEKIRYDGDTDFSYDNHHGIDYRTNFIEGKEIKASDTGVVQRAQ